MAWNGTQYVADYAGQSEAERVQKAIQYYSSNNMGSQLQGATDYWNKSGLTYDDGSKGSDEVQRATSASTFYDKYGMTGQADAAKNYLSNLKTNNYNVQPAGDTTSYKRSSTSLNTTNKQYYVPGQQSLEDAIASLNFKPRSQSELMGQAKTYADTQVNPQKSALQEALRNALAALGNQEHSVNANYAGLAESKDTAIEEASRKALESSISRGGGRSGVVEWATAEQSKPILSAYMRSEAQKTADLNNIANNKTLATTNYNEGLKALEEQRGTLASNQLAALLNGDLDRAQAYGQMRVQAELNLSTLLNSRDMYNIDAVRADTQVTGVAGGGLDATVPLRKYLTDNGVNDKDVAWNPADYSVTINGRKYSKDQLSGLGGYIENGRWQIPESAVAGLL